MYVHSFLCAVLIAGSVIKVQARPDAYVPFPQIATELGMRMDWIEESSKIRLHTEGVQVDFASASRISELNGIRVYLGQPVIQHRGRFYLSEKDYRYTLSPIIVPQIFDKRPEWGRIVIDPGHGGKDPGGVHPQLGFKEKDFALTIGLKIRDRLQRHPVFQVRMTREKDVYLSLQERAALANDWGADLFLSLHFNTAPASVRGIETFVLTLPGDVSSGQTTGSSVDKLTREGNQSDPWNALLGYYLQRELIRSTGLPDRGLKRARFVVLESVQCPAALLELGFLTNSETLQLLQQEEWMDQLADAVVQGVLFYVKTLQRIEATN